MKKFPSKKYNYLSDFFNDYKNNIFDSLALISTDNLKKAANMIEKKYY